MGLLDDLFGIAIRNANSGAIGGTPVKAGTNQSALAQRVALLRKQGYSDKVISQIISGNVKGTGTSFGKDIGISDINLGTGNVLADQLGGPLALGLTSLAAGGGTKVPGYPSKGSGGYTPNSGSTAGNILGQIFGNSPIANVLGAVKNRLSDPRSNAQKVLGAAGKTAAGVAGQFAPGKPGKSNSLNGLEFPQWDPNGAGAYPTYTPPELVLRDFTGQANDSVNSAFAPYFAALNQQRTDVQAKGDRDRQLVGGIYDKYVSDIANQAAQTQQRYDAEGAARAQQGQGLNAQIGQNYAGANDATAKLLQSIGAQQAAPELLQQGAADQGWQQSQADQNTQAHQDYYNTQQQAQADQDKVYGQAAQNEGVRSQANVLADVAAQLSGLGQKEASQRSENAMTALDLAMKMQGQDFNAQQANAQLGQGAYQSQVGAWGARNDAIKNQYQAAMDLYNAKRQQIQDQLGQSRWEAEMNQRNQFQQGDWALQGLKAQQSASKGIDPTGLNSVSQQIAQSHGPQVAGDISRAAYDVTAGSKATPDDPNAYFAFMQKARQIAEANGVSIAEIIPSMQQYWQEAFKTRVSSQ